jgi:hypothetical protein
MNQEKKQSLLDTVKDFFSKHNIDADVVENEPTVEVTDTDVKSEAFETVLLVDGTTEVTIEPAIEVGAAIVITAEDGTSVAAPIGEYELQDGKIIVVAEEGVVAEVREGEEVIEEEPMAEDKPEEPNQVKRIIERIESEKIFSSIEELKETVKFLKEENEALLSRLSEVEDSFSKTQEFTKQTFETLLGEPSAEPVVKQEPLKAFMKEESALENWLNKNN